MYNRVQMLEAAQVVAVRARPGEPFAFSNVDGSQLAAANPGQDIPFLLRRTPGAVFTSDAGNAVGYTGIRIRGADATRINITINGVPLNDAESQGVFWVNMPDFISSTSSLQIQRGVGSSTYGTGAFGANINLATNSPADKAGLIAELGGGSFNTQRAMIRAASGEWLPGLRTEARLSYIRSDGFVDRARSDMGSAFFSTSYTPNDRRQIQLLAWTGKEQTYQAWYGIPLSFARDPKLRSYNPAGIKSDGTFYEDQTDNYTQSHAQLLWTESLNSNWMLQFTGHYTRGLGFYEEWVNGASLGDYYPQSPQSDSISDLVRRLWLDNHFGGAILTLSGQLSPKLQSTFSSGINRYWGDHFGTVPMVSSEAIATENLGDYYRNDALKTDFNSFVKLQYNLLKRLSLYTDLQARLIDYSLDLDPNQAGIEIERDFFFFNPKAGLNWVLPKGAQAFASAAYAQREPNRNDFQDAPAGRNPKHERLLDVELGWRKSRPDGMSAEVVAYWMRYRDQLALTGQLNDVGEAIRVNIDDSYRVGLEMSASYPLHNIISAMKGFQVDGNLTLSRNRVDRFEEYIDNWSTGGQDLVLRTNTPLAFSPAFVANLGLSRQWSFGGGQRLAIAIWGNAVGEQFLDNSGSEVARLPAYGQVDLELRYAFGKENRRTLFSLQLQNLGNSHFVSNGWSYRFNSPGYDPRPDDPYAVLEGGDGYVLRGVYPQAGFQVLAGLRLAIGGLADQ